jgi:hypothetical protein
MEERLDLYLLCIAGGILGLQTSADSHRPGWRTETSWFAQLTSE